jgi:regulatory protein
MRAGPAPPIPLNEDELYNTALRALMRRAHSIGEMRKYLARRAEDEKTVEAVLARLCEREYLDDAKFAGEFARHHAQGRGQGRFRIARELRARGVADAQIEAALESVFAETNEAESVRARIRRKMTQVRGPLDQRKLASLYRSLVAAGFSPDVIRRQLRLATRAEMAQFPESGLREE